MVKLFDSNCLDLARHFYPDYPEPILMILAEEIQTVCEDFSEWRPQARPRANPRREKRKQVAAFTPTARHRARCAMNDMQQFLETFDAYALARDAVRRAPGEYAERDLLDMALFHWNRLLEARLAMKQREPFECICPTCGLRHGATHEKGQF